MKVSISELENSKEKSLNIKFEEIIDEIHKEIPITADLVVDFLGDGYINIKGNSKATISSICDRCLKRFDKELTIEINETFTKGRLFEEYKEETELNETSFIEDLNGVDEIDITDLIYQSVILNIPNKLVCDINCIGDKKIQEYIKDEVADPRLDVFKSIKTKE